MTLATCHTDRKVKARGLCNSCISREWREQNPQYQRDWKRVRRQEFNAFIYAEKSKPCTDCGKTYPPYVMDFDHLDKSTKSFNVARGYNFADMDKVKAEIAKCELVCANCHRMRTHLRQDYKTQGGE